MGLQTQPPDTDHVIETVWNGITVRCTSHDSEPRVVDAPDRRAYTDWLAEVAPPERRYATWNRRQHYAVDKALRYLASMRDGGPLHYSHVVRAFRDEIRDALLDKGHVVTAAEEWSD